MSATSTTAQKVGFPPQIKYIVGNEACERFSYYGMRSILVIFMTQSLMMAEPAAKALYHNFNAACYLLPLLGAFLSDRYLGKYRTIMFLSIVYCLGHGVLAMFEGSVAGMYWGLGLIALGSGGIKPCVSAHVGDQFSDKNKHLLAKVYDWFYFSINFGSTLSTLLIPWIYKYYGASWAFGIPGILMAIATYVFWLGRRNYVHVPPAGKTGEAGFMAVTTQAAKNLGRRKRGQSFFDLARDRYGEQAVEGAKAVWDIIKLFAAVSLFWALFDQQGSTWTLQAEKMDRSFFGMQLESSQIQALNPLMVMVLIPVFTYFVYPMVAKLGIKVTPLRKMGAGMILAGVSFIMVALFQVALDHGQHLSVGWQILPYLVITMSEVMVSITGLEFAYTQAPRAMKSTVMSFWLITVTVGNWIDAIISEMNRFQGASEFWFYSALMFVCALIFVFGAVRYKVRNYIERGAIGSDENNELGGELAAGLAPTQGPDGPAVAPAAQPAG
jgi:POT family proton-dependent oligopeptide transporter